MSNPLRQQSERYLVHGVRVSSEIPLPVQDLRAIGRPEINIVVRSPRQMRSELTDLRRVGTALGTSRDRPSATLHLCTAGTILNLAGIGDFLMHSDAHRITVMPTPGASRSVVNHSLVTMPLARALLDLDMVPLHASVVSVPGRTLAFVGPSGEGKSTLAAACQAQGAQVISDDMAVLTIHTSKACVRVGNSSLRLSAASKFSVGGPEAFQTIGFAQDEKSLVVRIPKDEGRRGSPREENEVQLDTIYLLERCVSANKVHFEDPGAAETTARLNAHIVSASMLPAYRQRRLVSEIKKLRELVEIRVLRMPSDLKSITGHARALLDTRSDNYCK